MYQFSDLSFSDIDLIGRGLGKLPYDEVKPLLDKLIEQFKQQQVPKTPDPNAPSFRKLEEENPTGESA